MKPILRSELPFNTFKVKDNLKKFKMLLYGAGRVGTTTLAGSSVLCSDFSPVLCVDTAGNLTSLAAMGFDNENLIPTKVKNFSKGDDNYAVVHDYLVANPEQFGCLVLDSLTALQSLLVDEVLSSANKTVPDRPIWLQVSAIMNTYLKKINSLPIHVIATAGEKEIEDEKTGLTRVVPALCGKLGEDVLTYFDIVGRMMTTTDKEGNLRRVVQFQETERFISKDSSGALGTYVVDPTMEKLNNLIKVKHELGDQ